MNETPDDSDKAAKEAKATRALRYASMILILVAVVNILLVLYNWRNNVSSLSGILLPLGMIFFGLAMPMIGDKEKKSSGLYFNGHRYDFDFIGIGLGDYPFNENFLGTTNVYEKKLR